MEAQKLWDDIEEKNNARYGRGRWHCDDLQTASDTPSCVCAFLDVARAPAHGHGMAPPLFATHDGKRVRVVMASRFGDVGITLNLEATRGYSKRVLLPELTDFSATPLTPNAKTPRQG